MSIPLRAGLVSAALACALAGAAASPVAAVTTPSPSARPASGVPAALSHAGTPGAPVLASLPELPTAAEPVAAPATPVGGPLLARKGLVVDAPAGTPAPPKIAATSWLLADLDTGAVLAAQNPHQRLRPASTLKTLTAVTLLPLLDKTAVYTASSDDANAEGSKVGVVPNGTYTVDQLFLGMFLPSGNDAALALAHAAGGVDRTVALMNAEAAHLQAFDTHAATPNGLDADGQFSSAYDLALIARAGLARPDFSRYVTTKMTPFPGKMPPAGKPRSTFMIQNQNKLLYRYDGAIGVKTGYTTLARSTFVGAAARDGHRLVVTVMHTGGGSWKEAASLLDWGFAHEAAVQPVGLLVDPLPDPPAQPDVVNDGPASASHPAAAAAAPGTSGPSGIVWAGSGLLAGAVALVAGRRVAVSRRRRLRRSTRPSARAAGH